MTQTPGAGYDRAGLIAAAKASIAAGSKSFAAASRLFDPATREDVWLLYGWARACDDLADDQHLGGALGEAAGDADRLATIRALTGQALAMRPTGVAAFDGFALVAEACQISAVHTEDVIAGFALDAEGWRPHSELDMLGYCYHVAGAIGVMMALVMGVARHDHETLDRACDLGIAFQLGNIARDIAEDHVAGRCYLPSDWLAEAGIDPERMMAPEYRPALAAMATRLAGLAKVYAASARVGAGRLPFRCRWAVLSAAAIYGAIAQGVARRGANAWDRRYTTGRIAKLAYVARAWVAAAGTQPREAAAVPVPRAVLARAISARSRADGTGGPAR